MPFAAISSRRCSFEVTFPNGPGSNRPAMILKGDARAFDVSTEWREREREREREKEKEREDLPRNRNLIYFDG